MHRRVLWAFALLLAACGSSSDSNSLPADAVQMRDYLNTGVTLIMPRLGGLGGEFPLALNPSAPGAGGIQFSPDPTPGAPPNSYVFTLDLDGDGNGSAETNFTGSAVFNGDPGTAWDGFGGHVDLAMQTAGGLGTLTGSMDFVLGATGGDVSGTGTFTEVITGNATTLTVDAATPLHIEMARGTTNSVANACASSLNGNLQLDVDGPTGTLTSTWRFQNTRKPARVMNASFTDNSSKTTAIPDADVTIPCGQSNSASDWVGAFNQNWACVPAECGSATLTLTVSGSQINIDDEDPPGSGSHASYHANVVSGNPHVVRGFFVSGPTGNTYREDFTWILAAGGGSFSQVSKYVYLEGPSVGNGGYCYGTSSTSMRLW
ncbi:MAG: hypothetical protein ABI742_12085, partial [Gemmatimonadota bacterium]